MSHARAAPAPWYGWLGLLALVGVAGFASSHRIVLAAGFELYLAPLFYLLAFRIGGVRLALPAAILLSIPSYFWWGHIFTIVLCALHVLVLPWLLRRTRSLATATLLYHLAIAGPASIVFLALHYDAPQQVIALGLIRKLLNDSCQAALVDLAATVLTLRINPLRLYRNKILRLTDLIRSSMMLIVLAAGLAMFVADAQAFQGQFGSFLRHADAEAQAIALRTKLEGGRPEGYFAIPGEQSGLILGSSPAAVRSREALQKLGCERIDDGASGPNDRQTFAYWLSACQTGQVRAGGDVLHYVVSTRGPAERAYARLLVLMIEPAFLLGLAFLLQLFVGRLLTRSIATWNRTVNSYGDANLEVPTDRVLAEMRLPILRFVQINNRNVALLTQRAQLVEAVAELKRGIDLHLASDVRYDRSTGELSFSELLLDDQAAETKVTVHPNDRLELLSVCDESAAVVEFRLNDGLRSTWHLLITRDLVTPGHWRSGCLLRLRQSKYEEDHLRHHARLVELGGMASALCHEMKQPLFTISLAAENGKYQLEETSGGAAPACAKFDRILDQVDRARLIMDRIASFSRVDTSPSETFNLVDAVQAAAGFIRPIAVQSNVRIELIGAIEDPLTVRLPRIGIEQIIVNALQNSIDAIDSRCEGESTRQGGQVVISIERSEQGFGVEIMDDGTGLEGIDASTALDAFATTKRQGKGTGLGLYVSRQIMLEVGGSLSLGSRSDGVRGAALRLEFPLAALAGSSDGGEVEIAA